MEVLVQPVLRRPGGHVQVIVPCCPWRITFHVQCVSFGTCSCRLHPLAHLLHEPSSEGAWSPSSNWRRAWGCGPCRGDQDAIHRPHRRRQMRPKWWPYLSDVQAKPCADSINILKRARFVYKLNTNQRFITFLMRFSLNLLFSSEHSLPCLTLTFCNN